MRVTNNYQSRTLSFSSQKTQSNIAQLQQQIASARSVLKPADNPAAAGKAIMLENSLGQITQHERNATYAESRLSMEESTLASMANTLMALRELALEANNDSIGYDDRQIILQEVDSHREELLALINSRGPNGEYLFSGTARTTAPYPDAINPQYEGNESNQSVNIGLNNRLLIGTSGRALLNFENSGATTELLTTIGNFQTALNENTSVGDRVAFHQNMAMTIAELDAAHTHITTSRSNAGTKLSRIESARENNSAVELMLTKELENTQGLDYAEAISRLESEIQNLEAIQATYSRLKNISLFNYL